ncbi:MAG: DUF493 domain-containing protein [Candidatus Eremiobacterota bacterium]
MDDELWTFPCDFPVKAMGNSAPDFADHVVSIVRRHAPEFEDSAVSSRRSSGGKFTSVTVNIVATSRAQIEAIYQDFHQDERVLYTL